MCLVFYSYSRRFVRKSTQNKLILIFFWKNLKGVSAKEWNLLEEIQLLRNAFMLQQL